MGNSPGPVNSPHKGPVTRKMFPFDDVIMIFRVTGPLCGEFTGDKGQWREALMLISASTNGRVNNQYAGDLRRYRAHYDITAMDHSRYGLRQWETMLDCNVVSHSLGPSLYPDWSLHARHVFTYPCWGFSFSTLVKWASCVKGGEIDISFDTIFIQSDHLVKHGGNLILYNSV